MRLYLDIETIPTQRPNLIEMITANVRPPGNIKKPESLAAWMRDKKPAAVDEAYRKTSLNGTYGEIICIGWAFDDEEPQAVWRLLDGSEANLLMQFYKEVYRRINLNPGKPEVLQWIGHYITGFDLRFMYQRSVINGVKPCINLPYNVKPWDDAVYDTKVAWTGERSHGGGSAAELAMAYDIAGKTEGMDGSKVWDAIKAGKYEMVGGYCKDDIRLARKMHLMQTFAGVSDAINN